MSIRPPALPAMAAFAGLTARELVAVSADLADLDGGGRWVVSVTFEGVAVLARFADWSPRPPTAAETGTFAGPDLGAWTSSLSRGDYIRRVADIRERIAAGAVYQVNLCRTLAAPVEPNSADPVALWRRLTAGNPAPYAGVLRLPGVAFVSASPELFLRRDGAMLSSGPIKGTAATAAGLTGKDRAENVMIVDLVRNDLARVCLPGTVAVPHLLRVEQHPGLVHLVSVVSGALQPGMRWPDILAATFPPGSVSGAPKIAALDIIRACEPEPRDPYCGAFGWIDADAGTAQLAVAIRSFWISDGTVRFGTGAGITWGSDPGAEWEETELKARRLIGLAAG